MFVTIYTITLYTILETGAIFVKKKERLEVSYTLLICSLEN